MGAWIPAFPGTIWVTGLRSETVLANFVLRFAERVDSCLHDLSIDCRRRAAAADAADALPFDCKRQAAFDTDEPTGTDSESLREHLVIRNFGSIAPLLSGRCGGKRRTARLGLRDERIVRPAIGHALECHQMSAGIDHADADDLFQLLGFVDGGLDDNIAALLAEF